MQLMRNPGVASPLWALTLITLTACGGGGGGGSSSNDNTSPNQPVPAALAVDISTENGAPMYYASNTFVVSGDNIDRLTLSAQGACATMTETSRTSGAQRRFTCRPNQIGVNALTITARDTQTGAVKAQSFTIPKPEVTLTTTLGPLVITLEPDKAPLSSRNFLETVASGFYTGTAIHEIAEGNRVLGGLYKLAGTTWTRPTAPALAPVEFESPKKTGLSNTSGTIAVYREAQALVDSGTTGFLINLGNHGTDANGNVASINNRDGTSTRDPSAYAVFGSLTEDSYNRLRTARASYSGAIIDGQTFLVPSPPVIISVASQTR